MRHGMDLRTQERNSRWDREPVLENGKPKVAKLTDRDIEAFKLLARYPYLPLDDIHAFVGGSLKGLSHHFNVLSRKPNLFINRPHQQRQCADANYRRLIYELDERGVRVLQERGLPFLAKKYHRNFAHELMVSRVMASIELGALRSKHMRLITWNDILANPKTPPALKDAPRPTAIPVSFTVRGESQTMEICADGMPFGIERANADGGRLYFFFPGIEADTGTEPIESYDFERSSIYKKFVAYRAIAEQGIHTSRLGFPNFFVPIITTTDARMRSMMRCLERITANSGSKMFLFKTFPAFNAYEKPPAPSGHMLTDPWHRAGFAPLDFTK
jgi:Replication-relaxation